MAVINDISYNALETFCTGEGPSELYASVVTNIDGTVIAVKSFPSDNFKITVAPNSDIVWPARYTGLRHSGEFSFYTEIALTVGQQVVFDVVGADGKYLLASNIRY